MTLVTFSRENSGVQSINFYRILYGFRPLMSSSFLEISPVDWAGYKHGKEKHKGKYLEMAGIFWVSKTLRMRIKPPHSAPERDFMESSDSGGWKIFFCPVQGQWSWRCIKYTEFTREKHFIEEMNNFRQHKLIRDVWRRELPMELDLIQKIIQSKDKNKVVYYLL